MHRISNGTQSTSFPTPSPVIGSPGYATGGVPGILAATDVDPDAWNAVQEEISGVIEAAGETLSKTNNSQLLSALHVLFPVSNEASLRASSDNAIIGSINNEAAARVAGDSAVETWSINTFITPQNVASLIANALASLFSSANNVTGSRAFNANYTNSSGKPLFVTINAALPNNSSEQIVLNVSTGMQYVGSASSGYGGGGIIVTGIIPAGANYRAAVNDGSASLIFWTETV